MSVLTFRVPTDIPVSVEIAQNHFEKILSSFHHIAVNASK
jgi:hypothetical protein